MAKELLMGNEAIGLGAIHAGVGLVSAIPGRRLRRYWRRLPGITMMEGYM